MSARAVTNRQILLNITNMDDNQGEITLDKNLGGVMVRDVNGVKSSVQVQAGPTTNPTTTSAELLSPSCGENGNNLNKFESGSGSGEHDIEEGGHHEDGIDTAAKKRKTRRGKPKHRKLKPYSKGHISYGERLIKSRDISNRIISKNGRQPPAPYNTTQFLMEDHTDLPDLEQKLSGASAGEALSIFQKPNAPPRTRDSSFSIDSEDDYFYSSPEDEEEFLTKEFSTAYEDLHAERLGGLTKSELIQEYIQLESKVDLLTKRLRGRSSHQMEEREISTTTTTTTTTTTANDINKCGNSTVVLTAGNDIDIAKKLKIYQQRIDDLIQQNEQLRRENDALKSGQRRGSIASSVDSESDSDSTSDTSSCSCSGISSPIPTGIVTSGSSQIFIRRESSLPFKEQKINGFNSDDDSSRRFTDSSPKPNYNSNFNSHSNIISNGHSNNSAQEVNGLPT